MPKPEAWEASLNGEVSRGCSSKRGAHVQPIGFESGSHHPPSGSVIRYPAPMCHRTTGPGVGTCSRSGPSRVSGRLGTMSSRSGTGLTTGSGRRRSHGARPDPPERPAEDEMPSPPRTRRLALLASCRAMGFPGLPARIVHRVFLRHEVNRSGMAGGVEAGGPGAANDWRGGTGHALSARVRPLSRRDRADRRSGPFS